MSDHDGSEPVTVDDIAGLYYDPERPSSDDRSVEAVRWRIEHDYDLCGRNQPEYDARALLAEFERLLAESEDHRLAMVESDRQRDLARAEVERLRKDLALAEAELHYWRMTYAGIPDPNLGTTR